MKTVNTISVITPSYNQGAFLGTCLDSVAKQTVLPVEHLVFDPGSVDGSRQIAASFGHVTLIAEDDDGQSDAVNKGFERASGDIVAWINSDDYYCDDHVFETVLRRFNDGDCPDIVYGKGIYVNERGEKLRDVYVNRNPESLPWRLQQECGIFQPALFMRRSVIERVGFLTKSLHYCMDYEYWIRCVKAGVRFVYLDEDLACFRFYDSNKTLGSRGKSYREVCDMLLGHFGYVHNRWLRLFAEYNVQNMDGVLATRYNTPIENPETIEREYIRLLRAYNGGYDCHRTISDNRHKDAVSETFNEMTEKGLAFTVPADPVDIDTEYVPGKALRTVGERRWAFDLAWRKRQFERTHDFLRKRIAERKNDVCVIVGNGPSLAKTDLSLLKGQDVIISNNAFLSDELIANARYYTVVNYLVAEQSRQHINRLDHLDKIIPYWLSYCINDGPTTWFLEAIGYPEFSTNIFENASWRHTVSFFNLHIAYGLGYRRVVLIGFDHNYVEQKGASEGEVILSHDDDSNHFSKDYFKGKKWQAANVDEMEKMYLLAKKAYEDDGRTIVNATVGGNLSIFERRDLKDALAY
ncbi:hypothetical protein JCM14469_05150 [Desulfatiferula olefinivorans]